MFFPEEHGRESGPPRGRGEPRGRSVPPGGRGAPRTVSDGFIDGFKRFQTVYPRGHVLLDIGRCVFLFLFSCQNRQRNRRMQVHEGACSRKIISVAQWPRPHLRPRLRRHARPWRPLRTRSEG